MGLGAMIYEILIGPLILLFDSIYAVALRITSDPGLSIVFLSLAMNLLVLPLYRRADALQEEEKIISQRLKPGVDHIKKTFKGDERFMMLQTFYQQNHYKPYYALKGSLSLLLEIPFFIGAYNFLSNLQLLNGVSAGPISDLGKPDGLLSFQNISINVLPILMTGINIISGTIYSKDMPLKSKVQLYGMALIFLVFLYDSPSGLVLYWTLNNLFSLLKNIVYKIPNPKKSLKFASFSAGLILCVYVLFIHRMSSAKQELFFLAIAVGMMLPLLAGKMIHGKKNNLQRERKTDNKVFYIACIVLTVLTGLLIPSAVIKASPAEFIQESYFRTPIWYIVQTFLLAVGTFLVWLNVYYRLSGQKAQRLMGVILVCLSMIAVVNYMFFGQNYGNMSPQLQYDEGLTISTEKIIINTGICAVIAILITILYHKKAVLVRVLSGTIAIAIFGMAMFNITAIAKEVSELKAVFQQDALKEKAMFSLDRKGKNVVVIMLDRAIDSFIPFLFAEKPELQKQFSGFIYYPNTISYGSHTNVGSPGLFGGYEYIPEEMNKRDDMLLKDKHNEALKVMPVMFLNEGYRVTVCDAPYAGYKWVSDMSIYNDYPEINKYITKGSFDERTEQKEARTEEIRKRNFFCYSIFRISPVALQKTIYNNAQYNESDAKVKSGKDETALSDQVADSPSTAHGSVDYFKRSYLALKNLPNMTHISDSGQENFIMMANDATHDVQLLQEPEYEPVELVDNREYDEEHKIRESISGDTLMMENVVQYEHYQANMAAFLKIGEWLDYLRENNVYDNTRIILVSDHGRHLNLFDQRFAPAETGAQGDAMMYQALLMVKDFDSMTQGIITDNTFMTNADTPLLAAGGLVELVNPFTGNKMTETKKENDRQHVVFAVDYSPETNNGYKYKDLVWITFKGEDVRNPLAWSIEEETDQ